MKSSEDFHCTCGQKLGEPHPSGNWTVYPNPLICPKCKADNQPRFIPWMTQQATKGKRR